MPIQVPKEQFRRMFTEFRNLHIIAGMRPLVVMRQELIANDEFADRGGTDTPTQFNLRQAIYDCDKTRRHVTHNPEDGTLGDEIAKAVAPDEALTPGQVPFAGDTIQNMSGGLIDLPWRFDGTDPNIPLMSQLSERFLLSPGGLILGAIDRTLSNWTRMNSKDRTKYITQTDSMRMYGAYREILGVIDMYLGDENRVDVVQVLPSEEPLGPLDSPNIKGETTGSST
tara:strand:- start:15752 stop:16429 length:678 start_codon:yes stop_codon:yes gene_type:complete